MTKQTECEREDIWKDFGEAVNMTPAALRKHLDGEASREVGQKKDGGESTGHAEGRRVLAVKDKAKSELTDEDYAHMRKVVGYVARHMKQGGASREDPESRWRMSLMNWGHDPLKG